MQEPHLDKLVVSRSGLQLSYANLRSCLDSVDFFSKMMQELPMSNLRNMLYVIGRKLEFREFSAEEVVYSKGDTNRDIYFVIDGEVGAFVIANNVLKEIRSFYSLQGFGDAEAITQTNRMFATISKKPSLIAILKSNQFEQVLRDYHQRVYQLRLSRFSSNYILKGLTKNQLELIVHNAVEVRMTRHQLIYEHGQPSEEMYLIEKGQVRLFNEVNRKQIEICKLEDGELVGQTEMILDHPRTTSAICLSDTLLLYRISRKLFTAQASEHLLNSLYQPLQDKETQRLKRFNKFCAHRVEVENPEIRLNRIAKMLEKGRKLANKRYSQLDDGNVYGSVKEGEVANRIQKLIRRKQKIMEENYGIDISTRSPDSQRHVLFDYKKELRPRVLHSKSNRHPPKQHAETQPFSPQSRTPKLAEIRTIHKLSEAQQSYLFREPKLSPTIKLPTLRRKYASFKESLT